MREKNKKELLFFILRTSMYTRRVTQDNIVSFITGYELGVDNNRLFTSLISKRLEEKYKCEYRATGWPGQIREFAIRRKISWVSGFIRIGLELINEDNVETFQLFIDKHIRRIIKATVDNINVKINNTNIHFHQNLISEWIGICAIKEEWFCKLWTKEDLILLKRINKEILSISDVNYTEKEAYKSIPPTDKLLKLAEKLAEKLENNETKYSFANDTDF